MAPGGFKYLIKYVSGINILVAEKHAVIDLFPRVRLLNNFNKKQSLKVTTKLVAYIPEAFS